MAPITNLKAMENGKGWGRWAYDEENGNFEVLSSYAHLLYYKVTRMIFGGLCHGLNV